MQDNKDFLGTEPIGKLLLKLSIPTVSISVIYQAMEVWLSPESESVCQSS